MLCVCLCAYVLLYACRPVCLSVYVRVRLHICLCADEFMCVCAYHCTFCTLCICLLFLLSCLYVIVCLGGLLFAACVYFIVFGGGGGPKAVILG